MISDLTKLCDSTEVHETCMDCPDARSVVCYLCPFHPYTRCEDEDVAG